MKTSAKILIAIFTVALAGLTLITNTAQAQLTVDTSYTPTQLVQDILVGPGITASNIKCNCPLGAYGFFKGVNSNIGIPGGVLLTTGDVFNAVGPNLQADITTSNGVMYTDSQLISIDPDAVNDPCILEFDFIPDSNHVEFKYVFGSDEYHEWVNAFNDVFGFFLTGPGISNPNNNIALVPSTTTPIGINTVNNGYSDSCQANGPCTNCTYFFDNCNGATIEYDAFTTVLKAQATVMAGLTYHIKLAIADALDDAVDSGVFLQCGSFSSKEGGPSPCSTILTAANKDAEKQVAVYPNPVTDQLTLSLPHSWRGTGGEVIITDMVGQQLLQQSLGSDAAQHISTKEFKNGIYLLQIRSGGEIVNKRFVVGH